MINDVLDLVMYMEGGSNDEGRVYSAEELLDLVATHKEALKGLQGSYGRMVANLESAGLI